MKKGMIGTFESFRIIDEISPLPPGGRHMDKPTLKPYEVGRIRRMQGQLEELLERLEEKAKVEWNGSNPDAETMFIIASLTGALKHINMAIEHHEIYRLPPPEMVEFDMDSWKDAAKYGRSITDLFSDFTKGI